MQCHQTDGTVPSHGHTSSQIPGHGSVPSALCSGPSFGPTKPLYRSPETSPKEEKEVQTSFLNHIGSYTEQTFLLFSSFLWVLIFISLKPMGIVTPA